MAKAVLMKKGESLRDELMTGALYRNIFKIENLETNVTHILPATKTQPFSHKGVEIKIMVKGELEYHVGKETFILQAGDMLFHPSNEKHWAENKTASESIYVTVSTPPTFSLFEDK